MRHFWEQAEQFGLVFRIQKIAYIPTCLWSYYILKEESAWLSKHGTPACSLWGGEFWSGRSSQCVLVPHSPWRGEVWCCWVTLHTVSTMVNLKVMSFYFCSSLIYGKGKRNKYQSVETAGKGKGRSAVNEWSPTENPLPRIQRKWKPCPSYFLLRQVVMATDRSFLIQLKASLPKCTPLLPKADSEQRPSKHTAGEGVGSPCLCHFHIWVVWHFIVIA